MSDTMRAIKARLNGIEMRCFIEFGEVSYEIPTWVSKFVWDKRTRTGVMTMRAVRIK
jgi:hypothetical protein